MAFSAHTDLSAYSNYELESQIDARSEALRQIELSCSGKAGTAGAGETGAPADESGLGKTITALLPLCRVEFVCGLDRQALKAAWCNESCAAAPDEKPASCPSCDDTSGAVASSSVSRPGAWSARRARSTVAGSQMLVSIPALRHARRSVEMGTGSAIGRFVRLAALSRRARSKNKHL